MFSSRFVINSLLRKIILIICFFLIIGALIPVHANELSGKATVVKLLNG